MALQVVPRRKRVRESEREVARHAHSSRRARVRGLLYDEPATVRLSQFPCGGGSVGGVPCSSWTGVRYSCLLARFASDVRSLTLTAPVSYCTAMRAVMLLAHTLASEDTTKGVLEILYMHMATTGTAPCASLLA